MSPSLFVYLITLTAVYLYPNSRGSLGILWALVFVLLHVLMSWILPGSFLVLTLSAGGFVLALFLILHHSVLDPFADSNVYQFFVGIIESLARVLGFFGVAPKARLIDAHDSVRVRRVYTQLKAQRWSAAEEQILNLPDGERYQLIRGLADVGRRPAVLDEWKLNRGRSAIAWVVSGQQIMTSAWAARGPGLAHTVTARGSEKFLSGIQQAKADLRNAISVDRSYCDAYLGLLIIAMAEGAERKKLWDLFARVRVLSPDHYEAHVSMAIALTPKWGGGKNEALEFARVTAKEASATSALVGVLAVAHIEYWLQLDIDELSYESEMYFRTSPVLTELKAAYHRLDKVGEPDCGHIQALNAFAFCFYKGGQYKLTREVIARLQGDYVEYPWQYCVEPLMATFDTAFAIDHVVKKLDKSTTDSIDPLTT